MDKENFVPVEESFILRELGFKENCISFYTSVSDILQYNRAITVTNTDYDWYAAAPLWQQAFDWFENQYGLYISKHVLFSTNEILDMRYFIKSFDDTIEVKFTHEYDEFERYKARLACLQKLISIVKKQQDDTGQKT